MAASASGRVLQRPPTMPNSLARWRRVMILLQLCYLIGHVHGAPKPMEAVTNGAWKAAGEGEKIRGLGGPRAGFGEAKGMGDMKPPPYSEHNPMMDSHPDSEPLEEHSSTREEIKNQQDEGPKIQLDAPEAAATRVAENIQKSKILESITKNQQVLEEQDSLLLGLRMIAPDIDKASETLRLDYRAMLVQDMKLRGRNAQKWLKELPPPSGAGADTYIKDEWEALKAGASDDYKLATAGFFRSKIVPMWHYLFNRTKWLDSKLDKLFLKFRLLKDSQPSTHDLIVLEMDNVRRAGTPLPKEQIQLLERIVEVGKDVSKLKPSELELLTKLSGKTVTQRRLDMLSALRIHIHELDPKLLLFGGFSTGSRDEVRHLIGALEALKSNAERGINWTKEQTQLVVDLRKFETIDKIFDQTLSKEQKLELQRLAEEETTIEQLERFDQAIHRLAMKKDSKAELPGEARLFDMLHQRLEAARRGSTVGLGLRFTREQDELITKLAEQYGLQMETISVHTNPKAIDISDGALLKYELPINLRAEKVISEMESRPAVIPNARRTELLKKLQMGSKNPSLADQRSERLATQYDQYVKNLDARHKAEVLLRLDKKTLAYDVVIRGWLSEQPNINDAISPEKVGKEKADARTAYLVGVYHQMVDTMSPEEKASQLMALNHLEKNPSDANKGKFLSSLPQTTLLNSDDRFLTVTYAQRHESLEKLAENRLLAMRASGVQPTAEAEALEAKLKSRNFFALSEMEKANIRHLALAEIVLQQSDLSAKTQRVIMAWIGLMETTPEDVTHSMELFNRLKPDETAQFQGLFRERLQMALGEGVTQNANDPQVMKFINLAQHSEKRKKMNLKDEDIKELEALIQSQNDIRADEIAELQQNFQKKAGVLMAFANYFRRENNVLKQPGDLELPPHFKQFLDQRDFFKPPTSQPLPKLSAHPVEILHEHLMGANGKQSAT